MSHIVNYAKVVRMIDADFRKSVADAEGRLAGLGEAESGERAGLLSLLAGPRRRNGVPVYPVGSLGRMRSEAMARLDEADRAGRVFRIECKVSWSRSRTWGLCPHCEARVWFEGGDGRTAMHYAETGAGGYGYDKLSSAVQEGISCPAVDRLVIENRASWDRYAVGTYQGLPRLSVGGKGVGVLRELFEACGSKPPIPGFSFEWVEGRHWDYVNVERKRR